ncbi:MAG: hypothetical protein IK102_03450 [Treponema sp.]|nr:hypothetical protein [Treponema sp.]
MMNFDDSYVVEQFFSSYHDIFTVDFFWKFLKSNGVKITKANARMLLDSSEMVFALVNDEYITRAGVFLGRWFSFMPTAEEIQKGYVLLGHRCLPFVNPNVQPDKINVTNGRYMIQPKAVSFSMNLALDTYALFGDGYVIPCIFNDHSNTKLPLSSVQYGMPASIELTAWPLSKIIGGRGIRLGDRILGRVVDWAADVVELSVLPANSSSEISSDDIEREEWYSIFEKELIKSFEENGPEHSIEQQLAFLFLENQNELCKRTCGSTEEFLKHTKKIGFSPYGVESRIWYANTTVPYIGNWNKNKSADSLFTDITMIFSTDVIDAYLENYIFEQRERNSDKTLDELLDEIFPSVLRMTPSERKLVLLNLEKRHDILDKVYNQFADYKLAPIRQRTMELFSQVSMLLCSIGCSGLKLEDFPQQELVILVQLFSHVARIVEEMESDYLRDIFPYDDIQLSLDGMEETFEDVGSILHNSLETITYDSIKIVN